MDINYLEYNPLATIHDPSMCVNLGFDEKVIVPGSFMVKRTLDKVTVIFPSVDNYTITIKSLMGKTKNTFQVYGSGKFYFSTESFLPGVYILTAYSAENMFQKKLIIGY